MNIIKSYVVTNIPATVGGGVTSFSSGNLSPLFTTSVATPTTTPALSFTIAQHSGNVFIASPADGSLGNLTARALVAADLPTSHLQSYSDLNFSGL